MSEPDILLIPRWPWVAALVLAVGPGDDDEDDDPNTGGSGGNIDPEEDEGYDDEDDDDDEEPLQVRGFSRGALPRDLSACRPNLQCAEMPLASC